MKDVLILPAKSLGDFLRAYGKDWTIGYISMWLIDLNDSVSAKTKMNDAQIEFTAARIFEKYSLKITDLTLFFRNVKEGVYGSFYESISAEKIMQWLDEYFNQRCQQAEMLNQGSSEFDVRREKMHPDVFKAIFKDVSEPPKKPPPIPTDSLESHLKMFRSMMLKHSTEKLRELKKKYKINQNTKPYAHEINKIIYSRIKK